MTLPCKDSIKDYFKTVFSYCEGYIPLRSFPEKKGSSNGIPYNIWIENDKKAIAKAIAFANRANDYGYACYIIPGTVNKYGKASADSITQMQTLLVDIDTGDIKSKYDYLVKYLGQPSLSVESGGLTIKGEPKLHLYWKLSEAALTEDLQKLIKLRHLLALKIEGDIHFQSAHQPIRLAGSIYYKNNSIRPVLIREVNQLEHHLPDLIEGISNMPNINYNAKIPDSLNFNIMKQPFSKVLTTTVHEGGKDEWTRFEGLSRVIGYWVRRYHEGLMSEEETWEEIISYNTSCIIPPWPEERLKAETNRLLGKHISKYGEPKALIKPAHLLKSYSLRELLSDPTPTSPDIIAPRILTPGGLMVFAGAPKVGKSDFLLSMFAHMAAGVNFLSFSTIKPLKIFYLQAEVQYDYLRERLKKLELSEDIIECASDNLYATPQLRLVLNDQGLESIISHLKEKFGNKPPDIIAIDPLRNVFDGGKDGNENDNNAMLFFLTQRIEKLRAACNPNCGIILVHHTRKTTKEQLEADPFQALSGAGSLRSFYSSGMLLFRPDETRSERHLYFELRNGAALERKLIDKPENRWVEINPMSERLVNQSYGLKLDAERIRKGEKIVKIIYEQAKSGKVYNINQFTESFESKCGLGSKDTINERIKVYATKGYIKFFKNYEKYNLPSPGATKFGYMCVEGMYLGDGDNAQPVYPTHFKHP